MFVTKSEHNKNCTIGSGYFDDDVLVYGSDGATYPYRSTNYGSGAGGDGEPSDNTVLYQQYGKYEKLEKWNWPAGETRKKKMDLNIKIK